MTLYDAEEPHQALIAETLSSDVPVTVHDQVVVVGSLELARLLARTLLETPGVVRVEPTLRNAIFRLTAAARTVAAGVVHTEPAEDPDRFLAVDGIGVVVSGSTVDVTVDIAVDGSRSARETAHLARDRIDATVRSAGLTPGRTTVTILTVDAGSGGAPQP